MGGEGLFRNHCRELVDAVAVGESVEAFVRMARGEVAAEQGFESLRELASTGVNFISVGALTHSAPALDLSLILSPLP